MTKARIKKGVKPHGGRAVTVLEQFTRPNGVQAARLILGVIPPLGMEHWTQRFGRHSRTVLEYDIDELDIELEPKDD
jgi:hypothetical protein